jgi:hypothetical protein
MKWIRVPKRTASAYPQALSNLMWWTAPSNELP